jgi:hypothetical protein
MAGYIHFFPFSILKHADVFLCLSKNDFYDAPVIIAVALPD